MSDVLRAAANEVTEAWKNRPIGHVPTTLEIAAEWLARAYLSEHTPAPDGPPAPECRRCLGDHRIWSTNDETGRWLLCPECSGLPLAYDGVAPIAPWRPRLVAVGDREVRLHTDDGAYRYLVHVTPGHAEPFAAVVNAAMVRGPTPDGPPAADPERQAGERFLRRHGQVWHVMERASHGDDVWIATVDTEADADLLAHGPARLRALEAALRMIPLDSRSVSHVLGTDSIDAAHAALGAGPGA